MRGDRAVMRLGAALAARPTSGDSRDTQSGEAVGVEQAAPGDTVQLYAGDKVRLGDSVLQFHGMEVDNYPRVLLFSESQARHLDRDSVDAERERQRQADACHV